MRIIANELHGHWSARFADGSPGCYGGPDAFGAIQRLIENSPERDVTLEDFEPDLENCRLNRVEMVLVKPGLGERRTCSTSAGTGQYVGLIAVEACQACGGTGTQPANEIRGQR